MRILLACMLAILCAVPLLAASEPVALAKDPVTGLTADQAVKLGFDKFSDLYEKKADAESTAGMRKVSYTFAGLRRYVNERATEKRTKQQRLLIAQARDLCQDIHNAYVDVAQAAAGGGTMYNVFRAHGMVEAEITVGKLILSMEKPKASARGRAEADRILKSLVADIDKLPAAYADDTSRMWIAQRSDAVKRLRVALPKLQQLLKSVPDNGALDAAQFARAAREEVEE